MTRRIVVELPNEVTLEQADITFAGITLMLQHLGGTVYADWSEDSGAVMKALQWEESSDDLAAMFDHQGEPAEVRV